MNKEKVYNITSNFISENKLFQYPIDLFSLCKIYGWKIKYYNKKDNKEFLQISTDGFVVENNNKYIIFLNQDMIESRQRFTIAHEIDTDVEQEANMFARLILCPAQITRYLPKNSDCISNLFKVSKQMAELTLKHSFIDLKGMECIEDISYEKSISKFQEKLGIETNIFEY